MTTMRGLYWASLILLVCFGSATLTGCGNRETNTKDQPSQSTSGNNAAVHSGKPDAPGHSTKQIDPAFAWDGSMDFDGTNRLGIKTL